MIHTTDQQKSQQLQLLNAEIRYQWNLGAPTVFERPFFRESLETLLTKSKQHKEAWLLRITTA